MIFNRKIYGICCNDCGRILQDDKNNILEFDNNLAAITRARTLGWYSHGQDYCPECARKRGLLP